MKANELMVGDYISVKPSGMPIKIAAVHHKKVAYHAVINKLTWVRESLLEPIPLTPEILEKNGFKKFDFLHIKGQYQWAWWENILISVTLWCRELNNDTKDGMMLKIEAPNSSLCLKVNYIHELQHALRLCGIEKEII